LYAQSSLSTFQDSMAHDRCGPEGFHMQAITDSSKTVYKGLRGTPTVPQESPEMVSSAYLCGSVSTASPPLSSVVSPSSSSVGPFPPPLHCLHRTTLLSLGHARRIRPFLCPRALHPLLSLPPTLPPSAHQASRAALTYFCCPPCVPSFTAAFLSMLKRTEHRFQ